MGKSLRMSQLHMWLAGIAFTLAGGSFFRWTQMRFPPTPHPRVTELMLLVSVFLAFVGSCIVADGNGFHWFRAQPPWAYGLAAAGVGVLWLLWDDGRPVADQPPTKLKCSVSATDPICVRPNINFRRPLPGGGQLLKANVTYFRLKVQTVSAGHVDGCCARLLQIERNGEVVFPGENFRLPFVTHGIGGDPFAMRVTSGTPEIVDVIVITNDNEVWLATHNFAHDLASLLAVPGEYVFRMVITAPGAADVRVAPAITWTGNRSTSAETWREA